MIKNYQAFVVKCDTTHHTRALRRQPSRCKVNCSDWLRAQATSSLTPPPTPLYGNGNFQRTIHSNSLRV